MKSLSSVHLLDKLISCNSITPNDGGAIVFIADLLAAQGFTVYQQEFGTEEYKVKNLYARIGNGQPNICFAGHVDVVPPGAIEQWLYPPFQPTHYNGKIYGRGAVDMKGAMAAMLSSGIEFIRYNNFSGTLSFLITSDEEGIAEFGTKAMIEWVYQQGHSIDFTIIGEPTCATRVGDTIKVGRRGSINFNLNVYGTQGHVAYPELVVNCNHLLIKILDNLISYKIDNGNASFQPSNLEVTSIDTDNPIANLVPAMATAKFNIRFNDMHTSTQLYDLVKSIIDKFGTNYQLTTISRSEAFLSAYSPYTSSFKKIVHTVTGISPILSTTGGTSDGKFIHKYSPVVEFGLLNSTAHKTNEHCLISDLQTLYNVYYNVLGNFLKSE